MLISKAQLLTTTLFAIFSFYAIFYSLYQCQLKFDDTSEINLLSQDNSTWYQHKVKVVFVIIDGFRFDYLLNYENIDHDKALQVNKLKKFNQKYFDNPEKFVVIRALSDLPTMTVFRVPCFMTGNVPRLGSVLTAFGALPASEDSVPRQLYLQGKKSYFSGDPILHEYFPKYIESDFKLGAFNVRDKRADAPSQAYISEKLTENKFDFLAAHFLRLDHAGHHQDLYWKGVVEALDDLDQYLLHVMDSIDDDTMLIFGGDHGQTKQGGHGGSTLQETNTALVAYHKKGFMKNKYKNMDLTKIMRSINETDNQNHQIDLTPTLSVLMGLPSPFSNMGQILNDLYPAGDYLPTPQEECPETAFLQQLVRDNHLNTLQVWNYFKKYHEGQSLFSKKEFAPVADLYNEVEAAYREAETMISNSQQCQPKFQEITINAIAKSQQLSNQVHDLVNGKTPHEVVVFWQAFLILILACASYILQIQYIYSTNDYEEISWKNILPKDRKAMTKTLIPFTILLGVVWAFMLASSPKIMRPITSTVLFFAVYILGKSIISFLAKQRQEPNSPTTISETEENQGLTFAVKLGKSFLFQSCAVAVGAGAIIAFLFFLTHGIGLHLGHAEKLSKYDPYICVMLIACGIYSRYVRSSRKVFATASALCIVLKLINAYDLFWTKEVNIIMSFIFLGDWLWDEIQFSLQKLKAGVAWSYQYIAAFVVLIFYHLLLNSKSDFTQITVPRVIWFIIIGSCLASFALKMPKQTIKRNVQVNLVLFLCLMQMHHKFVHFTVVLSFYRIVTHFFKRAQFKNYLYALILALISYVGLFYIGFSDRNLPRDFGPAFVGLRDFHIELCLFLYGSAMLSTIILAILFMSFSSQNLELQEVELGVQMDESDCEAIALKGNSKVIRKRNLIMFCFLYNLIMIGAAIHPIILTDHKKINLSMERFLAVGTFYLFTINTLYFVF